MKNRFNINEQEKNRIRGLHGIQVINEQDDGSAAAVDLPDGKYMLRGNCRGYKILTRPESWARVHINDGGNRETLTDEHEKALYTGYDTSGPCARCPCEFEYNATVRGGKLVSPSGRGFSGVITKGEGEAGPGDIAPPEGQVTRINNVKAEGIKNVSDQMVKNNPFKGYIHQAEIGGTFGGESYIWNCEGVDNFNKVVIFGRTEGLIMTEKNSYVSKIKDADTGELITDAVNDGNFFGFVSTPDYKDQFIVYTSTSGPKAVNVKLD